MQRCVDVGRRGGVESSSDAAATASGCGLRHLSRARRVVRVEGRGAGESGARPAQALLAQGLGRACSGRAVHLGRAAAPAPSGGRGLHAVCGAHGHCDGHAVWASVHPPALPARHRGLSRHPRQAADSTHRHHCAQRLAPRSKARPAAVPRGGHRRAGQCACAPAAGLFDAAAGAAQAGRGRALRRLPRRSRGAALHYPQRTARPV